MPYTDGRLPRLAQGAVPALPLLLIDISGVGISKVCRLFVPVGVSSLANWPLLSPLEGAAAGG